MTASGSLQHDLDALFSGDPALCADPYPLYRQLREESPVHFSNAGMAVISRHADAKAIYRDGTRFRAWKAESGFADEFALLGDEELEMFAETSRYGRLGMSGKDGEEHRRVRNAVHRNFTPARIAALEPVAQAATDELIERLAVDEVADLAELAFRVPLYVILSMLGMPRDDAELIRGWGQAVLWHMGRRQLEPEGVRMQYRAWADFGAYVDEMVVKRQREPGQTDLVAALVAAQDGDRLSGDELVVALTQIITGGHETTSNMIGNGMVAMLRERSQWELLCADPDARSAGAVEESLRYDAPMHQMKRLAVEDVEIGGVTIPADTKVTLLNAAANRDPAVFEDPDRVDITRNRSDHLTFSHGPHHCLGAALARLEGRVVYSTLARRFPEMELAVAYEDLEWRPSPALHGVLKLPVVLGPDRDPPERG